MPKRIYSLDILKIFAIILIVFHHYQQMYDVKFSTINFFGGTYYIGYVVEFFFVVSGFVIYPSIRRIQDGELNFVSFFKKRYLRLLPLLAITALVFEGLICCYHLYTNQYYHDFHFDPIGTIATALGFHAVGIIDQPKINNPTWYISVLLECYIVFYIATKISAKIKLNRNVIYSILALSRVAIIHYDIDMPFVTSQVARGFMGVFVGLILSDVVHKYYNSYARKIITIISAIINISLIAYFYLSKGSAVYYEQYYLTFIFYPTIVSLFTLPAISDFFKSPLIGEAGKISFDVFMWHAIVFIIPKMFREAGFPMPDFKSASMMLIMTIIAIIVGVLSYYFIEKPFNRILSKH